MSRCVVGPEGAKKLNVIKQVSRLGNVKPHTIIRRVQLGMANPATDPPNPEKTDPAEAGTKAGSEIIKAATIGDNSTGHRLFLQVTEYSDGWRVELHGSAHGFLFSIARGLSGGDAFRLAHAESIKRGVKVYL